jgi:hypothetical protein
LENPLEPRLRNIDWNGWIGMPIENDRRWNEPAGFPKKYKSSLTG